MISQEKLDMTLLRITECMPFCPQSAVFKVELSDLITRIIGDGDIASAGVDYTPEMRLEWLTKALIENVGKWPERALVEVRAVYCCKFKPADGRDEYSVLPGFSPEDIESGMQAACLSRPAPTPAYLPQPGDEPIGSDLTKQIGAAAKRLNGGKE